MSKLYYTEYCISTPLRNYIIRAYGEQRALEIAASYAICRSKDCKILYSELLNYKNPQ